MEDLPKNSRIKLKTQRKNSNQGKKPLPPRKDFSSPTLPSGIEKSQV